MKSKSILKSKTFWINVLMATAALGAGQMGVTIPEPASVVIVAISNILLRILTTEPVHVA